MTQGISGRRTTHAIFASLIAIAGLLAAPGLAQAVTTVTATESASRISIDLVGDGADSSITVTGTSTDVVITGADLDASADDAGSDRCTGTNPVTCEWTTDDIGIEAALGDGNDTLDVSELDDFLVFSVLEGEGGNDVITGAWEDDSINGGSGNDVLRGGWGDDFLTGGPGSDTLFGDGDDDVLILDEGEADAVGSNCGDGFDSLYNDAIDPLVSGCEEQSYYPPTGGGSPTTPTRPTRPTRPTTAPIVSPFTVGSFRAKGAKGTLNLVAPAPGKFAWAPVDFAKPMVKGSALGTTPPGAVTLPITMTAAGKKAQKKKTVRARLKVTFKPIAGPMQTKEVTVTFKKIKKKKSKKR